MEADDRATERTRLSDRLALIEKQQGELWFSGLSAGGGVAFDDRRWDLEEEARVVKSRLAELEA